jgi:hypothetical protein
MLIDRKERGKSIERVLAIAIVEKKKRLLAITTFK